MTKEKLNRPKHLVIIPDGNRRWAKALGLKPWDGHEAGAKNTEKLLTYALENNIECVTIWGSSIDNIKKRPLMEKRALLKIYEVYFKKLLTNPAIEAEQAKVSFLGRWETQFPNSLKTTIYALIEKTKNYDKKMLNFMLAYSGDDEMLDTINRIHDKYKKGTEITAKILKESLMTSQLPPVDYMIRTGGDAHLSAGFMMWDTANAQLFFADEKFPDFDTKKLAAALVEYSNRQRRFGK
ncbi:polyprenyl diphosphate synthase [Candidatus Parcubacteria bacterium]|nr:di-trans,poly-cis-decaprenylcistransferase [Patescibacteria group bacterium]MBU4309864.1 di-trans,poly-cis-decaprenylcistransferase [Patescibacteria group bacterium]MBU4431725.1 di-trans,poly-cis-decaprenylcistransferase [Patescibacteria group bacterium]MBU4578203.1 di-trans,poly-cis-decaprenylcistransferase [Patescibacteria group bacterium]MCG2696739.1 polyprenyl diphosphate synthase [Candidatus Parcubacteria bacterium]